MPLTPEDLRQKFRIVPGQEAIVLTPMNPKGLPITVDGARKRTAAADNEFSVEQITATQDLCVWILPDVNLEGHEPVVGDRIQDSAGTVWIIKGVNPYLAQAEWKALCQKAKNSRT